MRRNKGLSAIVLAVLKVYVTVDYYNLVFKKFLYK